MPQTAFYDTNDAGTVTVSATQKAAIDDVAAAAEHDMTALKGLEKYESRVLFLNYSRQAKMRAQNEILYVLVYTLGACALFTLLYSYFSILPYPLYIVLEMVAIGVGFMVIVNKWNDYQHRSNMDFYRIQQNSPADAGKTSAQVSQDAQDSKDSGALNPNTCQGASCCGTTSFYDITQGKCLSFVSCSGATPILDKTTNTCKAS